MVKKQNFPSRNCSTRSIRAAIRSTGAPDGATEVFASFYPVAINPAFFTFLTLLIFGDFGSDDTIPEFRTEASLLAIKLPGTLCFALPLLSSPLNADAKDSAFGESI